MNLLGIDVGTTGCKVALFSLQGEVLASTYGEYDPLSPQPGWAELELPRHLGIGQGSYPGDNDCQPRRTNSGGGGFIPRRSSRACLGGPPDFGAIHFEL